MLIDKIIRTEIFSVLDNFVIVSGKAIPIYHKVPTDAKKPYVEIIGQSTVKNRSNKDKKGFQSIVPIRVITASLSDSGGDLIADLIEQQVVDLIDDVLVLDGFSIIDSDYQSQSFNQVFGKEYQTHKIINFSFTIIQH